jgi:hypothetical protein
LDTIEKDARFTLRKPIRMTGIIENIAPNPNGYNGKPLAPSRAQKDDYVFQD